MDYRDMDEASREKLKKEQINERNKKRFSSTFMILASLFMILETVFIMFASFILGALIVFKWLNLAETNIGGTVYSIMMIFIFIGGLVTGFIIYKNAVRWSIKKFKLKDKLSYDVLNHYFTKEELKS
ncbi:MAG: hypothetical protein HUK25_09950 [Treponema sp.]|nr:hypothetical protein [Treponema sp.]